MKEKLKQWLCPAVLVVLLVWTARMILANQPLGELLATLRSADIRYLLLGFGLMGVFVASEAGCTWQILRVLGTPAPFRRCFGYSSMGFYFSTVTPSATGGQPAQVCAMAKDGIPAAHGTLDMLLVTICYQLATVLWAIAAILFLPISLHEMSLGLSGLLIFGFSITLTLTLFMVLFLIKPSWSRAVVFGLLSILERLRLVKDFASFQAKMEESLNRYAEGGRLLRKTPSLFPRLMVLSLVQLTMLYLIPWTVYRALGIEGVSPFELASLQAVLTIAASMIPLPGAAGISETLSLQTFALFFGSLASPAVVLSRGISCYGMLLITGIITLGIHVRKRRSSRRGANRAQVFRPYPNCRRAA